MQGLLLYELAPEVINNRHCSQVITMSSQKPTVLIIGTTGRTGQRVTGRLIKPRKDVSIISQSAVALTPGLRTSLP